MKTYRQFLTEAVRFYDADDAYQYALNKRKRVPDVEKYILEVQDAKVAYMYARNVIEGRWPEAEPFIKLDPMRAYHYANSVIQGRWPEAEEYIRKNVDQWWNYLGMVFYYPETDKYPDLSGDVMEDALDHTHTEEGKWSWLKVHLTKEGVQAMDCLGMTPAMQEYAIKARPDLIHYIHYLDPALKAKYQHEDNLGRVDL